EKTHGTIRAGRGFALHGQRVIRQGQPCVTPQEETHPDVGLGFAWLTSKGSGRERDGGVFDGSTGQATQASQGLCSTRLSDRDGRARLRPRPEGDEGQVEAAPAAKSQGSARRPPPR